MLRLFYQFEIGPLLELKQQDGDCLSSVYSIYLLWFSQVLTHFLDGWQEYLSCFSCNNTKVIVGKPPVIGLCEICMKSLFRFWCSKWCSFCPDLSSFIIDLNYAPQHTVPYFDFFSVIKTSHFFLSSWYCGKCCLWKQKSLSMDNVDLS